MCDGWIKLDRKLLEWEWYQDANTVRVFLHLLLKANFKDTKYMGMLVKRGSLITKLTEVSEQLNLSKQQVRTAFEKLKKSQIINTQTTNKFTLVTIVNYSFYQDVEIDKQQTSNNQITNEQQSSNIQSTHLDKERKNDKKEKNDKNGGGIYTPQEDHHHHQLQKEYIAKYLKVFPTCSPLEIERLMSWEDELEDKLISLAIDEAVNNNVRKLKYIEAILNNCLSQNIRTAEQFKNKEMQRRNNNAVNGIKEKDGANTKDNPYANMQFGVTY